LTINDRYSAQHVNNFSVSSSWITNKKLTKLANSCEKHLIRILDQTNIWLPLASSVVLPSSHISDFSFRVISEFGILNTLEVSSTRKQIVCDILFCYFISPQLANSSRLLVLPAARSLRTIKWYEHWCEISFHDITIKIRMNWKIYFKIKVAFLMSEGLKSAWKWVLRAHSSQQRVPDWNHPLWD